MTNRLVIFLLLGSFLAVPGLLLSPQEAQAQPWSGIIDSSRAIDWSQAGVPGGIPPQSSRTQCGSTITATNNASVIQSALDACGANQFVKLGPGKFNLTAGVNVTVNNTTLRGSGPDQTILKFFGGSGCIGWWGELGLGACSN